MSRAGAGSRLLVQALFFLAAMPVQALAMRLGARRLAGWIPVLFHRLFLRMFGLRIEVRGEPARGTPVLVLANHVSWLDISALGSLMPLSFVAKSEVAGWPVVGLFARLQRTVFIDRARRTHTATVNATVAQRLAAGDVIVLFPEGTSSDGNRVLPFRSALVGAARSALEETGAGTIHLQPLAITYTRRNGLPLTRRERPEVAWYGDMDLAPHLLGFLTGGPFDARVVFGRPIPFDAATDRKQATAEAEAAVRRAFHAAAVSGRPGTTGASPVTRMRFFSILLGVRNP
ncbi:MAG TPA: 1-acyl-sn-glycerol-3-phosphate acyltransferase [Beijerinckiaceae bacterium]|jgi:1-acyl-sn-glycerol-3-phosphate acyltransferase